MFCMCETKEPRRSSLFYSNTMDTGEAPQPHRLSHGWTLWAHLPNNNQWDLASYVEVDTVRTVEEALALFEYLPSELIESCMLFVMRQGITPRYEDPKNIRGGFFSYKVPNKLVATAWRHLAYALVGNTLSAREDFVRDINGITISPKKNFCILKLWMANTAHQNASVVTDDIRGISSTGCLFGTHKDKG